jgi:hypothetical protein
MVRLFNGRHVFLTGWCQALNIVEGTLSIQEAQSRAVSMVEKKASELGMKELCENLWGRRGELKDSGNRSRVLRF